MLLQTFNKNFIATKINKVFLNGHLIDLKKNKKKKQNKRIHDEIHI